MKKRGVIAPNKQQSEPYMFEFNKNLQDDKEHNDFSMAFNQDNFYQNILNGSDYAVNSKEESDAYDLNENLN